jgi:hypothetical protein
MALTYLDLTNELLREFNEVELDSTTFSTARGLQARAKDCINVSIRKINSAAWQWPFLAVEHTQVLTAGTYEYAWPTTFKNAEWNSFQVQKDDALNAEFTMLKPMERDEWYQKYKNEADRGVASADHRGLPEVVFPTHGYGFGVHRNPDQAYSIKYRYYKNLVSLSAYTDETLIPEQFKHVLLLGAASHMYRFVDGLEFGRSVDQNEFQPALREMRSLLINDDQYVRDYRVKW